jgi:hypothetical protein
MCITNRNLSVCLMRLRLCVAAESVTGEDFVVAVYWGPLMVKVVVLI